MTKHYYDITCIGYKLSKLETVSNQYNYIRHNFNMHCQYVVAYKFCFQWTVFSSGIGLFVVLCVVIDSVSYLLPLSLSAAEAGYECFSFLFSVLYFCFSVVYVVEV